VTLCVIFSFTQNEADLSQAVGSMSCPPPLCTLKQSVTLEASVPCPCYSDKGIRFIYRAGLSLFKVKSFIFKNYHFNCIYRLSVIII
jgi:hypothetical protein